MWEIIRELSLMKAPIKNYIIACIYQPLSRVSTIKSRVLLGSWATKSRLESLGESVLLLQPIKKTNLFCTCTLKVKIIVFSVILALSLWSHTLKNLDFHVAIVRVLKLVSTSWFLWKNNKMKHVSKQPQFQPLGFSSTR